MSKSNKGNRMWKKNEGKRKIKKEKDIKQIVII